MNRNNTGRVSTTIRRGGTTVQQGQGFPQPGQQPLGRGQQFIQPVTQQFIQPVVQAPNMRQSPGPVAPYGLGQQYMNQQPSQPVAQQLVPPNTLGQQYLNQQAGGRPGLPIPQPVGQPQPVQQATVTGASMGGNREFNTALTAALSKTVNSNELATLSQSLFDELTNGVKNSGVDSIKLYIPGGSFYTRVYITQNEATRNLSIMVNFVANTEITTREVDLANDAVGDLIGNTDMSMFIDMYKPLAINLESVIMGTEQMINNFGGNVQTTLSFGEYNIIIYNGVTRIEPGMFYKKHLKDDVHFINTDM